MSCFWLLTLWTKGPRFLKFFLLLVHSQTYWSWYVLCAASCCSKYSIILRIHRVTVECQNAQWISASLSLLAYMHLYIANMLVMQAWSTWETPAFSTRFCNAWPILLLSPNFCFVECIAHPVSWCNPDITGCDDFGFPKALPSNLCIYTNSLYFESNRVDFAIFITTTIYL